MREFTRKRFCIPTTGHRADESSRNAQQVTEGAEITGRSEQGLSSALEVVSDQPAQDFAVLRTTGALLDTRALMPTELGRPGRGSQVVFAGYPHGVPDLLIQAAMVAGKFDELGFYLDGSINGGNSGGPIVDRTDGRVVGIVTQRRYLGGVELNAVAKEARTLKAHTDAIRGQGSVTIMGINIGEFAALTGASLDLIDQIIAANANTGLGIGFHIEFALAECRLLKLT